MEQINRARAIINSNLSLTVVSFSVEIIEATPFSLSLFQLNKKRDSCRNGYNWSTSGTVLSERLLNSPSGQECSQLSPSLVVEYSLSISDTSTILYPFLAILCCFNPFLTVVSQVQRTGVGGSSVRG